MSFPLSAEIYKIGTRIYRRNPYKRVVSKPTDSGDTPDLYADEADDGPPCAAKNVPLPVPKSKPEVTKTAKSDVTKREKPEVIKNANPEVTKKAKTEKSQLSRQSSKEDRPASRGPDGATEELVVCREDPRVMFGNGKWTARVSVPPSLICRLIGIRGAVRREMEDSTGCRLNIPRKGVDEPVEVKSFNSLESVQRCLDRIDIIVHEGRRSARFTHFAAIPCTHPDILETYEMFKQAILSSDSVSPSARDVSLFAPSGRLHLTVCMMWLLDANSQETATIAMAKIHDEIKDLLRGAPLVVDVQGISIMNDDPAQCDVLYAKAGGEHLQLVADRINSLLVEVGLAPPPEGLDQGVKLHMTLMNSRYNAQASHSKRHSFDATAILQEFGEFYFGTVIVDRISICVLNAATKSEGYYQEFSVIEL